MQVSIIDTVVEGICISILFVCNVLMLQIDEVYTVGTVGTVVGGTVLRGAIKEGDGLLLGPTDDGLFLPVKVGSLHRNRLPCRLATAGQTACVSVDNQCDVRKVSH